MIISFLFRTNWYLTFKLMLYTETALDWHYVLGMPAIQMWYSLRHRSEHGH